MERRGKGQALVTRYEYDCQHRLIQAELSDGSTARYHYDAFGRRIRKTLARQGQDPLITEFLWQANNLIAESCSDGTYRSFIYEPGSFRPLVQLEGEGEAAEPYHYQLDQIGTPLALTSHSGQTAWRVRYRAYGNVWKQELAEVESPLRFQGQYHDAETGLHYNRHRYYQPDTGRFITPDPIGLLGGLNNYRYGTNPARWVDPLGLSNQDVLCPGGAVKAANTAGATKPADMPITQDKYDEIINLERGNRPENPKSYLPSEYVDAHEKLFEEQGGGFFQFANWLNPKSPHKTLPKGKFVGLSGDMDVVFDNAKKIQDPMSRARYLDKELALGLNEVQLQEISQSEIYYIRIKPGDKRFNYKMPTGNEPGALSGEWVPGGKTKGGAKEAALHGAEKIKHDGYVDKLINYFDDATRLQ